MKYNHNRPLSDFENEINILKSNGYNPIAVTQMYFEDTFVFETDEAAKKGFIQFEKNAKKGDRMAAWWYGKESFNKAVEEYEKESEYKVLVHWLN